MFIKFTLDLYSLGVMGCRKVARVLGIIGEYFSIPTPHHTTARQWMVRNGCYSLTAPIEKSDDWIALADLTISKGKRKALAIFGIRISDLEKRDDFKITHEDVEVLGLYPTEKSNGSFVYQAFKHSAERVGGSFKFIIIDQGSDIKKGAKLFQQDHNDVTILHDIPHKLSNVTEATLKNNPTWIEFMQSQTGTRKRAYQTELAPLMPQRHREKARFMDIGYIVDWPALINISKELGYLNSVSEERFQDYFGWIDKFGPHLEDWRFMVRAVEMIIETIRKFGLSRKVYSYLKYFFKRAAVEGKELKKFISKCLGALWEEVKKLKSNETMICSTELVESIFGKYKAINQISVGITGNILGICAFSGKRKSEQDIIKAMEGCSVKEGMNWIRDNVGKSVSSLRKEYLPKKDETCFV